MVMGLSRYRGVDMSEREIGSGVVVVE